MLYIVGTPIGNLGDMSERGIETLRGCSYVLAEDTRVTRRLWDRFEIAVPLRSYHSFSERRSLEGVLRDLRSGMDIGLVSDAGMPGVSDPGSLLIGACHEEGLAVCVVPGPCAFVTALVLSGWGEEAFQFRGFFPQKLIDEEMIRAAFYAGVSVYYEAPHRIRKTVARFPEGVELFVARELTKKFESYVRGKADEVLEWIGEPRGEYVLIVRGHGRIQGDAAEMVAEVVERFGCAEKDAMKVVAEVLGVGKRDVYKAWTESTLRR